MKIAIAMTATTKKVTFTEYLKYNDGTDTQYELVDGELIPMSLGTLQHGGISKFLERSFDDEIAVMGNNWTAQNFSVGVRSPRGGRWDTSPLNDYQSNFLLNTMQRLYNIRG
jgi:Uma2 family endonuclease